MTIACRHITFGYGLDQPVFQDFSLCLPAQGTVFLTAPSGRGKTTLLRLLAGLETPQAGQITGTAGLTFSWVFQQDRLLPWATVWQNAALAGSPSAAKDYLERLGLGPMLQSLPVALSGGMARRVSIARALTYGGDVVLLDEAFNGLDFANQQIAADLLSARFPLRLLVSHHQQEGGLFGDVQTIVLP